MNDLLGLKPVEEEEELLTKFFQADKIFGFPLQQTEILNFLQVKIIIIIEFKIGF